MQTAVNAVLDTTVKVYANVLTQVVTAAHIDTKTNNTLNSACTEAAAGGRAFAASSAMGQALAGE